MNKFHDLPNRLIYGANYVMRSYTEIAEVIAFLEMEEDQRQEREARR